MIFVGTVEVEDCEELEFSGTDQFRKRGLSLIDASR